LVINTKLVDDQNYRIDADAMFAAMAGLFPAMVVLKGISPLLSPELLTVLRSAGHGEVRAAHFCALVRAALASRPVRLLILLARSPIRLASGHRHASSHARDS
jgi:hypothetical protein